MAEAYIMGRPAGSLLARPDGLFSKSRTVFEDEVPVARMRVRSPWSGKDAGTLHVGGVPYDVAQEGSASSITQRYLLKRRGEGEREDDGEIVARAVHKRWQLFLSSGPILLEHGGRSYQGQNPAMGAFFLHEEGRDAPVGWVRREGTLSRTLVADLPSGWPPEARIFTLWLADVAWNSSQTGT